MKKVLEKIGCLDSAFEKVKNGAKQETERFPALGLVVPSYQKIIIVTCSCGMAKLMLKRLLHVMCQDSGLYSKWNLLGNSPYCI